MSNTDIERRREQSYQEFLKRAIERDNEKKKLDYKKIAADQKEAEFKWKQIDATKGFPPDDYTVTHVNQNHDLLVCFTISLF